MYSIELSMFALTQASNYSTSKFFVLIDAANAHGLHVAAVKDNAFKGTERQ